MNIQELLKNVNPQMLQNALNQMGNLTEEQKKQVLSAMQSANQKELSQKLSHLSRQDLERELQNNPNLKKQLQGNREVMEKINQLFQNPS